MFTWSFGCAPSPASVAMTSLAFMFDDVPEPVWNTSIGNCASCAPCAISSAAAAIRCASSGSSNPRSAFARAAAPFTRPSQRTTACGMGSPETGKFATAFIVSPPHSCSESCALMSRLRFQFRRRNLAAGQLRNARGLGRDLVRVELARGNARRP